MTIKIYVGIGDAHGLDSFGPEDKLPAGMLVLRAQANRHRHAIVFRVTVSEGQVKKIEEFKKKGKYKEALNYIKKQAKENKLGLMLERGEQVKKSWELIPNDDLSWW